MRARFEQINIGLLGDRQNGIIVGLGFAILGTALAICVKVFAKEPDKVMQSESKIFRTVLIVIVGGILSSGTNSGCFSDR